MKRPVLKLMTLVVVIYLFTLLALFPASLAARWFMPPISGLVMGPVDGTIWNGRIAGVEYNGLNAGNSSWQLDPLALLTLRAVADVQLDRGDAAPMEFVVAAGLGNRIEVRNLQGTLTLAELEQARLMPRNIASGNVLLNVPRLVLENQRPTFAQGRVGLTELQSRLLPDVPLGSFEGEIDTANSVITLAFRDVEAPLRVTGQAQLQPDGRYTVTGNITPTNATPDALRRGFALLGQPDASGRYTFSFNGQL